MKEYRSLLKEVYSKYIPDFRKQLKMSQQEMAAKLHISTRAYGDLERGKYCSSAVSLLFLLLLLEPDDIRMLLDEFLKRVHSLEDMR